MFPPHPTELLHTILAGEIQQGDIAIDATAGNGYDTLFLAREVGETGKVMAFDIQATAIEATRKRMADECLLDRVTLFQKSHCELAAHATQASIKVIVFNLGYLPGADRGIATATPATLKALAASPPLLKQGGILAVTCYPGHPQGAEESKAVESYFQTLPNHRIARYSLIATKSSAPFLLIARNGRKLSKTT